MGFLMILTKVVVGICAVLYVVDKLMEVLHALRPNRPEALGGSAPAEELNDSVHELYRRGLLPLNDSVYELYRPPEGNVPSMEVVFFHGFQHGNYEQAHLSAWSSEDKSCIWPESWLREEFPDARILTVSYNRVLGLDKTNPQQSGNIDMLLLVENLQSDLLSAEIGQQRCPVVLVGHSFGGVVIKKLCVRAFHLAGESNRKLEYFRDNLKGIFFYSTPHHGISTPTLTLFWDKLKEIFFYSTPHRVSFLFPRNFLKAWIPLLPYVEILSKETARLHSDFNDLWNEERTCKLASLGEGVASRWGTFYGRVVEEASSRYGADFLIEPGADHTSISRPPDRISRRFTHLTRLLKGIALESNNKKPGNFQKLPERITGIQDVVRSVKMMLIGTTWLGFYGMNGIGKTTLAMALFNDVERSYDYTCFIQGDKIQAEDMILQEMHYRGRKMTQNSTRLKNLMRGRKLLLILDGVDSSTNLGIVKNLINDVNPDKASLFVVTSRVKDVLPLEGCKLHLVEFLSEISSKELFLRCVTQNPSPNEHDLRFPSYVDKIVEKCDRLPLALEVVGEYLHKKTNEEDWKLIVRELDEAKNVVELNAKMWSKLRSSYCCLHDTEKNMFLDAATVFYKYDLSIAMAAWTDWPSHHWKQLVNFSLVWEDSHGQRTRIGMHKLLLSMGRRIALNPKENDRKEDGYRIWNNDEKAFALLSENSNVKDEEYMKDIVALKSNSTEINQEDNDSALDMDLGTRTDIPISGSELSKMKKLKYLWLDGFHIDLLQDSTLPSGIVYLHLSNMSFSVFPFRPKLYRYMTILSLNKIAGIVTIPSGFSTLKSLQILRIEDNDSLESLPESISELAKLKYLSIKLCRKLKRLPSTLGHLKALETLRICSCHLLLALPESIGQQKTLKVVDIMGCKWERLPDALGNLSMLIHFRVENCHILRSLPATLQKLSKLEILTIDNCDSLSELPICNLDQRLLNLKVIRITKCNSLKQLPGEFVSLGALEHIELNEICLRRIPDLQMITSLKTLRLSWRLTSPFPLLPKCLQGQVTDENYTSSLTFSIEDGKFKAVLPGNFQHVPTEIGGTLEGIEISEELAVL